MIKIRVLMLLLTFLVVGSAGTIAILYARGYRLDQEKENISFSPKGLLAVNSEPTGAQIYVDDELKTATNNTIALEPGVHNIRIKREGFREWSKTIDIQKEVVTQINAFLLPLAPSLTALTFSGAMVPTVSTDQTKIAYIVPPTKDEPEKSGIWVVDTGDLPLGFGRDPRQVIAGGDFTGSTLMWSPDGRELAITTKLGGFFRVPVSQTNNISQLTTFAVVKATTLTQWEEETIEKNDAQIAFLPDELVTIFTKNALNVRFSRDENKILYTATGSAEIPSNLVKSLPGASTQTETRKIVSGETYIFDIKEDRNFKVGEKGETVYWIPNSFNVFIPLADRIIVSDYDGTNKETIFAGAYVFPYAYPSAVTTRALILTNLGSKDSPANLYWLSLK